MSTTKASKKPAASKKTTTKKATAKKKSATKKTPAKKSAAKKPSTKKPSAKKPAAKATKPAKKATAKPAKKAAAKPAKKATATKPVTKPSAESAKPETTTRSSFTPPKEFTPLFVAFEGWVNGGKFDGYDMEAYQTFNEQYKPSDWTQNPETDTKMFSFAMDGTGGQFSIWNDGSSDQLEELPVVLLGSEGSTIVLTQNIPEFFFLIASGVDPSQIEYQNITGSEKIQSSFMAFVKKQWPGRAYAKPKEILSEAKKKLQKNFEAFLAKEMKK